LLHLKPNWIKRQIVLARLMQNLNDSLIRIPQVAFSRPGSDFSGGYFRGGIEHRGRAKRHPHAQNCARASEGGSKCVYFDSSELLLNMAMRSGVGLLEFLPKNRC
jgi:hypothetical protein